MRKSLFGNDGELFLYNDQNIKFAVAESFSAQILSQTLAAPAHFIGEEITVSNKVFLTLHGVTITDEDVVQQMKKSARGGDVPTLNFQGKLKRGDEIVERIVLRNLVQEGGISQSELSDGYIGVWTFWVNDTAVLKYFK